MTDLEGQLREVLHDAYDQPLTAATLATRVPELHRRRRRRAVAVSTGLVTMVLLTGGVALHRAGGDKRRDSAAPTTGQPTSAPPSAAVTSADKPGTVDVAGLSWRLPAGWHAVTLAGATAAGQINDPQPVAVVATQPLPSACSDARAGMSCVGTLPAGARVAVISQADERNIEGDAGCCGPFNDPGTFDDPDATCRAIGGSWSWTWQHLYGLRSHGHVVQVRACLSGSNPAVGSLDALVKTFTVRYYPDLGAGRSGSIGPDPGPYYMPGRRGYASTLCRAAFPHYATARSELVAAVTADGSPSAAARQALSPLPSGTSVAWCTVHSAGTWSAYAVYPGIPPVLVTASTSGPPLAPASPTASP